MIAAQPPEQNGEPKRRRGDPLPGSHDARGEALRRRQSERGQKGGRPPTRFSYNDKMRRIEAKARAHGHITLLPLAVRFWEGVLRGRIACSPETRARVAETVADRFGFHKKTELTAEIDLTVKTFDLGGYRDLEGTWHSVPEAEVVEAKPTNGSAPNRNGGA